MVFTAGLFVYSSNIHDNKMSCAFVNSNTLFLHYIAFYPKNDVSCMFSPFLDPNIFTFVGLGLVPSNRPATFWKST